MHDNTLFHVLVHALVPVLGPPAGGGPPGLLARCRRWWRRRRLQTRRRRERRDERRRATAALEAMSDRMLRDIGVHRGDIRAAVDGRPGDR